MPSSDQKEAAFICIIFSSSVSFISTSILICKLIYDKGYKQVIFHIQLWIEKQMILLLLFGDFLQSISMLFPVAIFGDNPPTNYKSLCLAQAFIQQFGILFQFFWAFNIALAANKGYETETLKQKQNRETFSFILGFLLPTILCLIPLISGDYSNSDNLCKSICFFVVSYVCLLLTFVLPMITIFLLNTVLFFNLIQNMQKNIGKKFIWSLFLRLMTYPMILFFTQIWFLIFTLQVVINDNSQWINYRIWCYFTSNLVGFLDVLAYGINAVYNNKNDDYINQNENEFEQSLYINLEHSNQT